MADFKLILQDDDVAWLNEWLKGRDLYTSLDQYTGNILHFAILENAINCVWELVATHRMHVDSPSDKNVTPLLCACNGNFDDIHESYQNVEIVQLLLRYGANVNAECMIGNQKLTPLISCMRYIHHSKVAQFACVLIDAGCDVRVVDDIGRNALSLFCWKILNPKDFEEVIERLIQAGSQIQSGNLNDSGEFHLRRVAEQLKNETEGIRKAFQHEAETLVDEICSFICAIHVEHEVNHFLNRIGQKQWRMWLTNSR